MLGPHSGEGAETRGGGDVPDHTHHLHGGGFEDGDSLDDLMRGWEKDRGREGGGVSVSGG
jgi:hypothetical protein